MSIKETLLDRLKSRQATVGIVGLGYVGLPLAVEFAVEGFTVIGIDLSPSKVDAINRGESYIPDIPTSRLAPLVAAGKLRASTSYEALRAADTVSICVPTPLRQTKDPDMSYVIDSVNAVADVCHEGMLIVLESTTYPGTTDELVIPRLAQAGFTPGENVFVAFSPERIDPANPKYGVRNTPKVVGGVTPACIEAVETLYSAAVDHVITVSSPATAEMVKLLENTFRAVNIGLVNEMALICDKLGIDVWEVIRAASSKPFGFMPFYPGPGLGGHCIPIDPLYLSWKMKSLNYNARFIELASEINTSMPHHVIDKVTTALNDDCKSVRGSKVVILGVAYKRDVDDVRESPALDVIGLLHKLGAKLEYHDPYVARIRLEDEAIMESSPYSANLLASADAVVIITDHSTFDYQHLVDHSRLIIDTRNATAKTAKSRARIVRI
ncbi:MAG: nucleotide sugar dehydrogenase [Chloroflexi bacterium]|uniref:nucleotide sugar dehydrogenase n=1 Tax=Candidatus Flexifilum breve TaxID=3140694 RepID=UPI003136C8D1|nr:nucleotide sugar dehydrogenase [Chloroflexota bacterium]